jgi:hypothetical protein
VVDWEACRYGSGYYCQRATAALDWFQAETRPSLRYQAHYSVLLAKTMFCAEGKSMRLPSQAIGDYHDDHQDVRALIALVQLVSGSDHALSQQISRTFL